MSTSARTSPFKRPRSPSPNDSPLSLPKSQELSSNQDRTSNSSPTPPVGMLSTKAPTPASRQSASVSSPIQRPSKVRPVTLQQLIQEEERTEQAKKMTAALEKILHPPALEAVGEDIPTARQRIPSSRTAPLTLSETPVRGANMDEDATKADQGSAAELSVSLSDCEHIIQVFQALKQGNELKLASTEASNSRRDETTATAINVDSKAELLSHIVAAHTQGYKSGVRDAKELLEKDVEARIKKAKEALAKDVVTRLKAAYDQGYKSGCEKSEDNNYTVEDFVKVPDPDTRARADANMERDIKTRQLEQCKEWLRGIVRARDAGEKAKMEALVSEAGMAEWLECKLGDGDGDGDGERDAGMQG